ncbi:MAG: hypothetical protein IPF92_20240 [Myxococcales bacterium]|nr:hypothetical protein [Myxococcales bacterium]
MAAALVVSLASARAGADEYDDPEPAPSKPSPRPAPTTKPAGATEAPRAFPDDDAALGAAARALLGEIARLACSSAPAEPLAATCAVARGPSPTLSALRAAALADALALALAHGPELSPAAKELARASLDPSAPAALSARARELGRTHGLDPQAIEASLGRATAALQRARDARAELMRAEGAARGDAALAWLDASVAVARELAVLDGKASPPPRAADDAQRLLLRVVALETDDDVKALARSLVLPLPPWTERVLFDANATFPVLGKETLLDGDLLLGYGGDTFGVSGFGSLYHHAYDTPQGQRTVVDRYEGRAEGVWWPALRDDLKLELRLRGGVLLYDSGTSGRFLVGSGAVRPDETSLVGHGGASVGLRGRAGPRFAYSVSAGGGVQWEDFSAADATGKELVLRNASPVVARGEARLRAQWNVAPSYLALRARADANLLALSTVKDTTTATATSILTVRDVQESQRLELFTRLFVDVDALGFFGFRPSAHVGVDVFSGDAATAVVPVLGGGLRRESF